MQNHDLSFFVGVKFGLSLEGITMIWGISRTGTRGRYAGLRGRQAA
jgi:hypothetical protein